MNAVEATKLPKARPLLSVIIPTHNRQEYAASAIRCSLAIPSDEIEVVVQDCSDEELLPSLIVPELSDPRLSYRFQRPAYMADNWNRALERATGEYVCIIGDDDGVNPEILQAAAWARREALDCLAVKYTADYRWGGTGVSPTRFKKGLDGTLRVFPFTGEIVTNVDTEMEIRKLLRDGGVYYLRFKLPKLYHGLVHRRCLEAVREKTGKYCQGLSPDIFPSVAIACTAPRMAVTDYPLTIPGACKKSNSIVVSVLKRQSKRLEDQPEFCEGGGYNWSPLVPRLYTVPPVWADSAVAALHAMGRSDLVKQLNLPRLAAHSVRANDGVLKPVLQGLSSGLRITGKSHAVGVFKFAWNVLGMEGAKQWGRTKSRFLMVTGTRRVHRIDGVSNIVEAAEALTKYLQDSGLSFAQSTQRIRKCQ